MRPQLVVVGLLSLACRADPGLPNYPASTTVDVDVDTGSPSRPGPDPYVAGEERLSLGIFYEGGASEVLEVNDLNRHFYIYESTFQMAPTSERREGLGADEITKGSAVWWGGGVHWDEPGDLSAWSTLHVSLKTEHPSMVDVFLSMNDGTTEAQVRAMSHGLAADGAWHDLAIPLTAWSDQGLDLSALTDPFILSDSLADDGDKLVIDNLYFTKENP